MSYQRRYRIRDPFLLPSETLIFNQLTYRNNILHFCVGSALIIFKFLTLIAEPCFSVNGGYRLTGRDLFFGKRKYLFKLINLYIR